MKQKNEFSLPDKKPGLKVVVPSFVDFLQSIIARQKLEIEKIQGMDAKAISNGNGAQQA